MKFYYSAVISVFFSTVFAIDENILSTNKPSISAAVYNLIPRDLFLKVYDTNFTPDDVSVAYSQGINLFVRQFEMDVQEEHLEVIEAMRNAFIRGISPLTYFSVFMKSLEEYMEAQNIILTPDKINELANTYYKLLEKYSDPNGPLRNMNLKMPYLSVLVNAAVDFMRYIGDVTPENVDLNLKIFINNINNS